METLNVFENMWILLGVAGFSWLVVMTVRVTSNADVSRWWLLIPVAIAASGVLLEMAVDTDREKIDKAMDVMMSSAVAGEAEPMVRLIANDYTDRVHKTKDRLVDRIKRRLKPGVLSKINRINYLATVDGAEAKVEMSVLVFLAPGNQYTGAEGMVRVKMEVDFGKTDGGVWQITGSKILEVNGNPTSWSIV